MCLVALDATLAHDVSQAIQNVRASLGMFSPWNVYVSLNAE